MRWDFVWFRYSWMAWCQPVALCSRWSVFFTWKGCGRADRSCKFLEFLLPKRTGHPRGSVWYCDVSVQAVICSVSVLQPFTVPTWTMSSFVPVVGFKSSSTFLHSTVTFPAPLELIFSWYNNYVKAEQWQHHKIETTWANRVGKVVRRHL